MFKKILCVTLIAGLSSLSQAARFKLANVQEVAGLADGLRKALGIGLNIRNVEVSTTNHAIVIMGKNPAQTRLILDLSQGRVQLLEVNQQGFQGVLPLFERSIDLAHPHNMYFTLGGNIQLQKASDGFYLRVGSSVRHNMMDFNAIDLQRYPLPDLVKVNLPVGPSEEFMSGYFAKYIGGDSFLNDNITLSVITRHGNSGTYYRVTGRIAYVQKSQSIELLSPVRQVISDTRSLDLIMTPLEKAN